MFGRKKKGSGNRRDRDGRKAIGKRLLDLFGRHGGGEAFYEELEDLLVESDLGSAAAVEVVEELRDRTRGENGGDRNTLLEQLKEILLDGLEIADLTPPDGAMALYLVLGVNGVGKTTTIAKLAHRFAGTDGGGVVLAAGDTFRAAAIDQLEIHGKRLGVRVVKQETGADPGAVIFDAIDSARSRGDRVILADTAGRMHNRTDLVRELAKIDKIARDKLKPEDFYRKILVIDATTGQNGLRQAETFHDAVEVDAVIMTKFDSSAKGGLAAAIGRKIGLPFAYLGRGEGMDDLVPFNPGDYLDELLAV